MCRLSISFLLYNDFQRRYNLDPIQLVPTEFLHKQFLNQVKNTASQPFEMNFRSFYSRDNVTGRMVADPEKEWQFLWQSPPCFNFYHIFCSVMWFLN
jgi:hypothetical protein